jgi:LCP family protein required for cell wall assembly
MKIFFASLVFISIVLSVTALGYILLNEDTVIGTVKGVSVNENDENEIVSNFDYTTELGKIAKNSNRINVLVVGLEDQRTDTILVASYDKESKKAELISIPRDTYSPREEVERSDAKKINATYSSLGIEGLIEVVQDILGIPINKYIILDYEAVVSCVDILGGVKVNVPFHMQYSDPYDDPPLIIDIPEGEQVLNGEQSLKFLRFRKGYANQDLGRIEAQQEFIKSAAKKAISLKLIDVIEEAYSNVKTNFSIKELVSLAGNFVGFSTDNISLNVLPGEDTLLEGLSFYIPNNDEIRNMTYTMYGINTNNENKEQTESNVENENKEEN